MTDRKTAWMWPTEDGDTLGITIDLRTRVVHWYEGLGCACDDSSFAQTLHEYQAKGSPLGTLPDDVQAELDATVAALLAEA